MNPFKVKREINNNLPVRNSKLYFMNCNMLHTLHDGKFGHETLKIFIFMIVFMYSSALYFSTNKSNVSIGRLICAIFR